ncbi:MAG: hypothetical protein KatS3mg068_0177 [Candidatus Sericytochromatia bacterium]|nr:MAG: hypothetical protein KatS3mg068_0177 [Candidatus Sericytochromatia bacterium]
MENPPYVSTKSVSDDNKKNLEKFYNFSDDLYNHFYFRALEILKENGILSYITSKTFWTIQTKKNLRELLLNNEILEIIDSGNPFKESAEVDTCIVVMKKNNEIIYKEEKIFYKNSLENNKNNIIIFLQFKK